MEIQKLINGIFRQDFKNRLVLGRALFGAAILVVGFDNIINVKSQASYLPDYIPFAGFFAILAGIIFIITGFFILAGRHLKKATNVLVVLYILFALAVSLPRGDIYSLVQNIAFIGAALLVHGLGSSSEQKTEESK